MAMKKILGLDLGTNSIGWAVVGYQTDETGDEHPEKILAAGSRIIPMDAATLGDFERGNSISQTADRRMYRTVRRLRERQHLRRERLLRVLDLLGFLPPHFSSALTRYGKLTDETTKLAWRKDEFGNWHFIFQEAYDKMLSEFRSKYPGLLEGGKKVPYDWTIYYLRKKALTDLLSPYELAWVLLQFNQKRGYYQQRGEEEEGMSGKLEEYQALRVLSVEATDEKKGNATKYNIHLENGMTYQKSFTIAPNWIGMVKEFIITTYTDKDGKPRKDKEKTLRLPKEDDWTLLKKKTESDILHSDKSVGEYIYDALLENPQQKIIGKLVRTVERAFYKDELRKILTKQIELNPALRDAENYQRCIEELYPSNNAYRASIVRRGFVYLFLDNIIFYQRPLKSKKSLISNCPYEKYTCIDPNSKEQKEIYAKCIAKSHPLYQEFRLWQFISNLRIIELEKMTDGKTQTNVDVTAEFLSTEKDHEKLYEYLNDLAEITQETLLAYFGIKKPRGKELPYRWNYVEDKSYPCNATRALMLKFLKVAGITADWLTREREERLWHILYSVDDKQELSKALRTFAEKQGLSDDFVEAFSKCPPFKEKGDYGAYSAKAIKKLLPLMRMGKYWDIDTIDATTKERINHLIDGEVDENINERIREKFSLLTDISQAKGLPLWQVCYLCYGRHSEAKDVAKWTSPDDIDAWLSKFKQHSMHNPIVEQIVTETLRTVRDIWRQHGQIDEIHIELGRNLKAPAKEREKRSEQISANENTNLRIRAMLTEFKASQLAENVRPNSPGQQDIFRIYEEYALAQLDKEDKDYDFISKVSKMATPSSSEILRYKLWLDQKYLSPYTGRPIPLSKLFTPAYEIEHIIPQSRYFDNSFSNKVICESEVNKLKDNQLGHEFICNHGGEIVSLSLGGEVEILTLARYERLVKDTYPSKSAKLSKLLLDDIPDKFIERQLNDTRYISKFVKGILSNIVREEGEMDGISKNVVPCSGAVTDILKKDWGINDVWNHIILPRFVRLNQMTESNDYTAISTNGHEIPAMPFDKQKGFNKKRIDHRHQAMDAIVIACTTRSHVHLINNEAALSENKAIRHQLSHKLRRYEKVEVMRAGEHKTLSVAKEFIKPWETFTTDVEQTLRNIVVSFKQNLRVITKTSNYSLRFVDGKKRIKKQTGDNRAIRKPLHKETVYGEINLRRIKTESLAKVLDNPHSIVDRDLRKKILAMLKLGYDDKKMKAYFEQEKDAWQDIDLKEIEVYYFTKETSDCRFFASRVVLDASFTRNKILENIADTGIQKILLRHLDNYNGDANLAFSPEGIAEMNRNIRALNDGAFHQPIYKVRECGHASNNFAVGERGNRKTKFVKTAKGTNLFFAVYEKEILNSRTNSVECKRSFATIPLNIIIKRLKGGLSTVLQNEDGVNPTFVLSPNDLVYVPSSVEKKQESINLLTINREQIYRVVKFFENRLCVIPYQIAKVIDEKREKIVELTDDKKSIKEICLPIKVDRLGNIIEINGKKV